MDNVFCVPTLVVVTGAGRGIGQACAQTLARALDDGGRAADSRVVLVDVIDMTDTCKNIEKVSTVPVRCVTHDLSELSNYDQLFRGITEDADVTSFEHGVLINNAGTMVISHSWQLTPRDVESYMRLNLSSMLAVTAWFVNTMKEANRKAMVVNMTSQSVKRPIKSTSIYATCKAARETMMRDMVAEDSSIQAFSFDPSLVDTHIVEQLSNNAVDLSMPGRMHNFRAKGVIVKPEQVAAKLLRAITEKRYTNGGRLDYHDFD